MLVDEMKVLMKAGDGGNGVVRWRHEKGKEFAGAAGGDGGRGGDVILRGSRDIGLLFKYRFTKEFKAERGVDGGNNSLEGRNGEDKVIDIPIGSLITNVNTGEEFELLKEGQEIVILKGGVGGFGNENFKSSRNTTPDKATPGKPGEEAEIAIELRLIADAGLVGLPNAGKSTLLNLITNAKAKIGNYQFTTLDPNLGAFYEFILADIPGLIEGAADGKGLGHKFLRHISRTKMLIHCVSLEDENWKEAYEVIRSELALFDKEVSGKPEIIVLTKKDLASEERIKEAYDFFKKNHAFVYTISIIDDESVKEFSDGLTKVLRG